MSDSITLFRVMFAEDRTRIETEDDVMGWGIRFPCGLCFVDWNRRAFPEDDRLEGPHISQYATLSDVEQGTGGKIETLNEREVNRRVNDG